MPNLYSTQSCANMQKKIIIIITEKVNVLRLFINSYDDTLRDCNVNRKTKTIFCINWEIPTQMICV